MHSVCQALQKARTNGGGVFCQMMNDVLTLTRLYLTLPVTTATSERLFSTLRRTKTFLRTSTTMGQARLNAALLATIYRHRTDQFDFGAILDEFVSANERRRLFFGKQQAVVGATVRTESYSNLPRQPCGCYAFAFAFLY